MPRVHIHADARCRQIERLVGQHPGSTIGEIAHMAGIAYDTAKAYLRRLVREKRIEVTREEPELPRGSLQRFHPKPEKKAAA